MVKTTLLERGMTEEQIEVLGEIFTPQQIADYSKLYLDEMESHILFSPKE